jgi:hypothetical protein
MCFRYSYNKHEAELRLDKDYPRNRRFQNRPKARFWSEWFFGGFIGKSIKN